MRVKNDDNSKYVEINFEQESVSASSAVGVSIKKVTFLLQCTHERRSGEQTLRDVKLKSEGGKKSEGAKSKGEK